MKRLVLMAALFGIVGCGNDLRNTGIAPTSIAEPSREVTQPKPTTTSTPNPGSSSSSVVESSREVTERKPLASTQIVLTSGSIEQWHGNGSIDIEGTRGFSLVGGFDSIWGGVRVCDESPQACAPGATLAFSLYRTGNDIGGQTVTLDGNTYTGVGGTASDYYSGFDIRGTVVFPVFGPRTSLVVTAPCAVTGYVGGGGLTGTFSGNGRLRLWVHQQHEAGDYWMIDRVECRIFRH